MRLVLDTNILISGLLSDQAAPGQLLNLWDEGGRVVLITAPEQIDELLRVALFPKIRKRLHPAVFDELVATMRQVAVMVDGLPRVAVSPDPQDNFLLAMAELGKADLLVTGDKRGLLDLVNYKGTRIVTTRAALDCLLGERS